METFENDLNFFIHNSPDFVNKKKYKKSLTKIKIAYSSKRDDIEYYKSQNAQYLYSIHYMVSLNDKIQNNKKLNNKMKHISNDAFIFLLQYYMDYNSDTNTILKHLDKLDKLKKYSNNNDMQNFIVHLHTGLKTMQMYNNLRNNEKHLSLDKLLKQFKDTLQRGYEHESNLARIIVGMFFIVLIIVLGLLISFNTRSKMITDELSAFKSAVENGDNLVSMTDMDYNIIYVNETFLKESGYTREELIGKNNNIHNAGLTKNSVFQDMYSSIMSGKRWHGEFINRRKDGSVYYVKVYIMPIFKNGEIIKFLSMELNVSDYVLAQKEIEKIAYTDTLTKLSNRASIENYLNHRLLSMQRYKGMMALMFIDLDKFKTINDTLGHDIGDKLLTVVANKIQKSLRASDKIARFGGDEFVIVIEDYKDSQHLHTIAKKVLTEFSEPLNISGHTLSVTLSIGIATYPHDAKDMHSLFKYADIAMYKAKDEGRNRLHYYKQEYSVSIHDRLKIEQALVNALQNNEFSLVYQPQYLLKGRNVIGCEVLIRWNSQKLGSVGPDIFIPICEDTGFIIELGRFIIHHACKNFKEFKKAYPNLHTISINVSSVQLYQENFVNELVEIVKKNDVEFSSIIIEITETHIMKNVQTAMKILTKIKEVGFNISIDDFGTGYSSLNYLKLFPIDELKIDKSFVDDLPHNKNDIAISKSILALSKSMNYVNVAEGIENQEQEDFLRENECKIGQGFFFSKPLKRDDFLAFLA